MAVWLGGAQLGEISADPTLSSFKVEKMCDVGS